MIQIKNNLRTLIMKKRNKKILGWSEREISQFLIWDYIENFNKIKYYNTQDFLSDRYKTFTQKCKRYKFALDFLDSFFLKLYLKNKKEEKRILFQNIKYSEIILETKKYYSPFLMANGKERLFALKNRIGYLGIDNLYQYVYNYLIGKDIKYLYQLNQEVEKRLKLLRPNYIVLWNDVLPIERATILASRKLGITTLEIQHGIYQSNYPLINGRVADYILVWGQSFKDLYIKKGARKSEEIYILGYPHLIEKPGLNQRKKRDYTVYYLGQNFEDFNKELININLKTVNVLNKICTNLGIKFIYRPHPGENVIALKKKLLNISFAADKEDLIETINNGDIFISFNSTALIEAAMRSKVCLQLVNYPLDTDNFERLGVCTKSFRTIKALEEYLVKIINLPDLNNFKPKFNNNYINISYNPGQRFLEILDILDKNNRDNEKNY